MADGRRTAVVAHPGAELYGSDRMALETVAGLTEQGWHVVVVVPNDGPFVDEAQRLGADTEILEVPVLRKSMLSAAGLAGLAGAIPAASRRIDSLLRRVRPDVLYVSTVTSPLWIVRGRRRRVPVVVHVHESERAAPTLLREAIAWPLNLADRVVVNSEFSRDGLLEVVPSLERRSVVLYNGVRGPAEVTQPRPTLDDGLRLAYIGRLSPRKGVDVAVEALALLGQAGVTARLDLVGSVFPGYEWYADELRATADRLGVAERVRFTGFRPSVWSALAEADIALVPSREEEPFGNTAVEAVLAGRPVAVSAIGGLAEAIDGFASALPVHPDDPAALAAAVIRIVERWDGYRRSAVELAPVAAQRYAPERYRRAIVRELEIAAGLPAAVMAR